MMLVSSPAAALLGALLALISMESFASGYSRTAGGHHYDDVTNDGPHALLVDNRGIDETEYTQAKDKGRGQGAEGSTRGHRRMQQAITVDVNFVIVKHTDGRGVTEEQMLDQMAVLNQAYSPDFVFKLNTTQVVTNDTWFILYADARGPPIERAMKTAHKRGGMETLSVYAVAPSWSSGAVGGGWATFPAQPYGIFDGVVFSYNGVPGGGGLGDVSAKDKTSLPHRCISRFNTNSVNFMWLSIPLVPDSNS
jgi:hypothetical protein